jgi:L-ascorbate metabolism protein UlaG (beta-lactamase superfamily)
LLSIAYAIYPVGKHLFPLIRRFTAISLKNLPALCSLPLNNGINNPLATVAANEVDADYIFVSHAHADHLGDTYDIAKRCNATVISTFELVQECEKKIHSAVASFWPPAKQ